MANISDWFHKRIMIVDDFAHLREDLKNILHSYGFTNIREYEDGKPAWSELKMEASLGVPYDIIFSDINMPIINGLTLLKEVRKSEAYKMTPIFMVSTETEKNIIMKAIMLGATDYIIKPFEKELIIQKLLLRLK